MKLANVILLTFAGKAVEVHRLESCSIVANVGSAMLLVTEHLDETLSNWQTLTFRMCPPATC